MSRRRRSPAVLLLTALLTGAVLSVSAAAQETEPADAPDLAYTMLGRGYAVVFGYPADEVPGGGDEEEPADPPPDQTCPEGERGVPEELQARIDQLTDLSDAQPLEAADSETPTPRGQPIKFDFGLADTSLRSDPGSHSIASFFYVDLGGAQEPWTSAETDGYASGHAREQERCGQPYFGQPGSAENVHVISRALDGPYAYAFNQTQRPVLPGGVTMRESITVAEMDGRSAPLRGKVASIAEGVSVGTVHADQVVSVVEYVTDGTEEGTAIRASVDVAGLWVAGAPVELEPGAPPVDIDGTLVGIAAPEIRRQPNGSVEVTVGGLYVGGQFGNPLGAQAKQAVFVGGVWYDVSTSTFPSFDDEFELVESDLGSAGAGSGPPTSGPPGGFAGPPLASAPAAGSGGSDVPPPATAPPAGNTEGAQDATLAASPARLGVYRAPPQSTAPVLVLLALVGAMGTATFVWARHRYPEIRAALGTPLFRWLDYGYRAFMRG